MANRVYSVEDIELQGWDKPIRIHPLTIKKLKKLFEKIDFENEDVKKKSLLDVFLDAVAVAMETFEPKLSDPDVLADHIDQPTLEHILDVAAGVKLNDPNLAAAMANNQDGIN